MSRASNKRHQQKRHKIWRELELQNQVNPYKKVKLNQFLRDGKSIEQICIEQIEKDQLLKVKPKDKESE